MNNIEIGKRIKDRRLDLRMTQGEVAAEVGVAISTIQRYEAGNIEKVKLPVIEAIARALGVNPDWLIGMTDDKIDYHDPDLIASIPLSYIEGCNGNIKQAYQVMQAVDEDAMREAAARPVTKSVPTAATDAQLKFALFNGAEGITDAQFEEVKRYAQYIKERGDLNKK